MKVSDILVRDASVLDLAATDKDGVLAELAAALGASEANVDEQRLLSVLRERESLQSTGIGDGVAIPHGKLSGIDRLLAAFARSSAGVDFEAIDGKPTHLFFVLVVPEHSGGQHLKALARISRFLRDESFRGVLESAQSLDEVFSAIEAEDAKF
jgi:PTS system nitrogen regulatory IIA component